MRTFLLVSALLALATVASAQSATPRDDNLIFVCDAGSSGTRVYGYTWNNPTAPADGSAPEAVVPTLHPAWVKRVTPGAATFSANPQGLAAYLQPLFDFAREIALNNSYTVAETPFFIGATAGFRLLSDTARESLIGSMRGAVANSGFKFTNPLQVRILSGTEEGLAGFLSANYLTGRLTDQTPLPITSESTVGILDMGGASLQIAFQTPKTILMNEFTFPYRQSTVSLYSYSFLGFGQDQFDLRLTRRIVSGIPSSGAAVTPVESGCWFAGYKFNFTHSGVVYEISGTGDVSTCIPILDAMTGPSTTDCTYGDNQCSIGCAYQPSIPENYVFYATASFYYIVSALLTPAYTTADRAITLQEIWDRTQQVCAMQYSAVPANGHITRWRMCYQGAWLISLLHRSFGFPLATTQLRFALQVGGNDISWAAGFASNEVNRMAVPVHTPVTCPPAEEHPEVPTPTTQPNGNIVINFANMFNGLHLGCDNHENHDQQVAQVA